MMKMLRSLAALLCLLPSVASAAGGLPPFGVGSSFILNGIPTTLGAALSARSRAPVGQQACAMGDSITANGGTMTSTGGLGRSMPAYGYTTWISALSYGRINLDPQYNFAVGGYTSTQILATLPSVLAAPCPWVIVEGVTNDPPASGFTVAQSIANVKAILDALVADGRKVVLIPPFPRSSQTATAYGWYAQVAQFERQYALKNPAIIVADVRNVLGDPSSGGYKTNPALSPDGTHPNATGAFLAGQYLANLLSPFFPGDSYFLQGDPNDVLNTTTNPSGNALTNGAFTTTTGGTFSNTGGGNAVTGTAPQNWTIQFNSNGTGKSNGSSTNYNGTLAIGTAARSDNLPGNWVTVTATNFTQSASGVGSTFDYVYIKNGVGLSSANLNPGDSWDTACEVAITNNGGLRSIGILDYLFDGGTGANSVGWSGMSATDTNGTEASGGGNQNWPTGTYTFLLRHPRSTVTPASGASSRYFNFQFAIEMDTTVANNWSIKVGRCTVKKNL